MSASSDFYNTTWRIEETVRHGKVTWVHLVIPYKDTGGSFEISFPVTHKDLAELIVKLHNKGQ